MGFKLTGKGWVRVKDADSDEEPTSRKGKRKVGSTSKSQDPPRKSPRLVRGCTRMVIESSKSFSNPLKTIMPVKLEDSLELSDRIHDPVAKKEDSMEYSAKNEPIPYIPDCPEPTFQDLVPLPSATAEVATPIVALPVSPASIPLPTPDTTIVLPSIHASSTATTDAPSPLVVASTDNTLLIGLNEAINGLYAYVSEVTIEMQDHMDSDMANLFGRFD